MPLEARVRNVIVEPRVAIHLLPRQCAPSASPAAPVAGAASPGAVAGAGAASGGAAVGRGGAGGNDGPAAKNQKEANELKRSGALGGGARAVPGFEGTPFRPGGRAVCFGFDLGQYNKAASGSECDKGRRVCGGCEKKDCAWPRCGQRPRG